MTFASRIAAQSKSPVYLLEFEGDELNASAFDATTNWTASDAGSNLATSATAKRGAASVSVDKIGGGTRATITNSTLTAMDFSDSAYRRLALYYSSIANVASVRIRMGSDASNYYQWIVDDSYLAAGWNRPHLDTVEAHALIAFSTTGTPTATAIDYIQISTLFDAAGNTLSGILVDWLTEHPARYSTARIETPRAATREGWMKLPNIEAHAYRPSEGILSIGGASCSVVDDGGASVLPDLNRWSFPGRQCEIRMGWRGVAEDDTEWETIHRGIVEDIVHLGRAWEFQILDHLRLFDRPVMQDATEGSPITLTGHPVTVFLRLALSTGNATNDPTYDDLTAVRGAGVPVDLFDIDAIEEERDTWMPLDTCSFTFEEPEPSLLTWFFRELCKGFGIVPKVNANGQLSIHVVRPAFGSSTVNSLGTSNIITAGGIPQVSVDRDRIYNQVRILYDWNATTDKFDSDTANTHQNADSIARYGVRELLVESKGLTDATTVSRVAKRYLSRLVNGSPPIDLAAFASTQQLQLGELLELTVPRTVPDIEAETYGISGGLAEVEGRGFNPAEGSCRLVLGQTAFEAGNYRLIGPSSLSTDYDGSSAAEVANYCFIADGSDLLGTANDPAHVIGPG